ncbi:hypothetical protein [Planctomycetes bacterium TBK1r]|uniref:RDD family protein n=1 Tax=Stieleria magnilauensis TaxID=2527963 RepID=A0ABX5XWA1_9BACT|nr:hypothetical protein TBK1r_50680 [Planctomycetes bacterium TBK1r]
MDTETFTEEAVPVGRQLNELVDSPQGTTMPRHLSAILDNLVSMLLAVLAAARIIWSRDKQRFGDRVDGTVVVFR